MFICVVLRTLGSQRLIDYFQSFFVIKLQKVITSVLGGTWQQITQCIYRFIDRYNIFYSFGFDETAMKEDRWSGVERGRSRKTPTSNSYIWPIIHNRTKCCSEKGPCLLRRATLIVKTHLDGRLSVGDFLSAIIGPFRTTSYFSPGNSRHRPSFRKTPTLTHACGGGCPNV